MLKIFSNYPMDTNFTNINIETLVLVAVWTSPFVFQGYFKITRKDTKERRLLFFRCECYKSAQLAILEDFNADDYEFTNLYRCSVDVQLERMEDTNEQALYLLKYALNLTLQRMLTKQTQKLVYIDEMATEAITQKIKPILNYGLLGDALEEVGFAVEVDFSPKEETGEAAALALLAEAKFGNFKIN